MSAIDLAGGMPVAQHTAAASPAPPRVARFLGRERTLLGLLARGAVFLLITLGIYRFWLTTDVRRFLWGNTEVAGDTLEYTGTARELLIGFLMALALLLPINALIFVGTLAPSILPYSSAIGFGLLTVLGQFAFFRARRYRLTRTVYRGIRFYQSGSAWNYALRSTLWTLATLFTLGLAYPWQEASLERYKLRHTHFGNLGGRFEGSGTRLFLRGILLWMATVLPAVAGSVTALALLDWEHLAKVLESGNVEEIAKYDTESVKFAVAIAAVSGGWLWAMVAGLVLYPVFRAIVLRWWIEGLRLGDLQASSRLRIGRVYGCYGEFIGYSLLFGVAVSIVVAIGAAALAYAPARAPDSILLEVITVVLGTIAYMAAILGYSVIHQVTVMLGLWRAGFETLDLSGLAALDNVQAAGAAASSFGEGLADALDVGGI